MDREQLAQEWAARIARLQQAMAPEGLDALLVTQHVDIYYTSGSMQAGYVLIPAHGEPTYYVRRSVDRAGREAYIRVAPLGSLRRLGETLAADYPELFGAGGAAVRVGAELDVLPAQQYLKLAELLRTGCGAELVDGSALLRTARMRKSAYEVGRIEAAAAAAAEALTHALPLLREGVTELEWMAELEYELRRRGHVGVMRMRAYNQEIMTGMVGAGAAAAEPSAFDGPAGGLGLGPAAPQSVSRRPIRRGEPILIDVGCCIDGYVIDQTRTAVIGELPGHLAAAYASSERLLRAAESRLLPGTPCSELYVHALAEAEEAGLAGHFMGWNRDQARFLGHGIGLEVDEWPVLARGFDLSLEPGMVLAVEPKFTFPGEGVVGIENTYLITPQGPRALTRSPERLIVL
ncbi:aminopeptidase P family protein [Paenibacillus sp. IB182496]|uniref:Aminopeptidase P family protein n=1 Tax=Paenibacillus sabuli TaxID=2772509 RepID=A0A927BWT4_9BACL|nr:Xaa-Pro peptidase family protein [Paenibacillus sabuli]MBD2847777.1 aminopeptidase P family protein [Paenibacillus sabuli]